MRILTITPSLGLGGTERAAQNFSIGYARAGHEVTVLNHGREGPRVAILQAAGCRVVAAGTLSNATLATLELPAFDVVHIHREGRRNDRETALLRWARPRARVIAETTVFFARDYGAVNAFIDLHLQLAPDNLRKWTRRGGKGLSVVIPNPVEALDYPLPTADAIQAFKTAHGIPAGHFVFGRIGQPLAGKWDPVIVPALAACVARNPRVHLLLVGASPEVVQRVAESSPALREHVTLLDMIADPAHLGLAYAAMDCFLHAARQGESFGYVLAEALLYGLPVITVSRPHRDNAQTEVIRHGIDGYVVHSRGYLAEAMERMIGDSALRAAVRRQGRQGVIDRFGLDMVSADALRLFNCLLSGAPAGVNPIEHAPVSPWMAPGIGRPSRMECVLASVYGCRN